MHHFFIIPTLNCAASCKYCFSFDKHSPVMSSRTFDRSLNLIHDIALESAQDNIEICFHGGEPLLAGVDFFKTGLAEIRNTFGNSANLSIQSNLWLLDNEFCELFKAYQVRIGTSLDGPKEINDLQRNNRYFDNTMSGVNLLKEHYPGVGCIASFSKRSAIQAGEILEFFIKHSMPFSVHAAVKPLNYQGDNNLFMSPEECGDFLIALLELYLTKTDKIKISTLDTMIKNVSRNESDLCTFTRCPGQYLAIGPGGGLYPCNRFACDERFSFGTIQNVSSMSDIQHSAGWEMLSNWQNQIDEECAECLHKNICHGGCPYNGFASGNGKPQKDPYCEAYKRVYKYILDRGTEEFLSEENIN